MQFCRENYKTFDDLLKIAIGHGKKNFACKTNPSCSFSGKAFVMKSSLNKNQRYCLYFVEYLSSIIDLRLLYSRIICKLYRNYTNERLLFNQPNYLNFGDSQPKKKMKMGRYRN